MVMLFTIYHLETGDENHPTDQLDTVPYHTTWTVPTHLPQIGAVMQVVIPQIKRLYVQIANSSS